MSTPASSASRASVPDHFRNRAVIGDQQTRKAELPAQKVTQQRSVAAGGDAVNGVERGHHQLAPGVNARAVAAEVVALKCCGTQLDLRVFAASERRAVASKMLSAGGKRAAVRKIVPLIAADRRSGKRGAKQRVFAGRLHHAPPAAVGGEVRHRRKGHVQPVCRGFPCRRGAQRLRQLRAERARLRQRDGEGGLIAVDHVQHQKQRDMVRMPADKPLLHRLCLLRAAQIQDRAAQRGILRLQAEHRRRTGLKIGLCKKSGFKLKKLPDLFLLTECVKQRPKRLFRHAKPSFI